MPYGGLVMKYKDDILQKVQQLEKEMLFEIHDICVENDINYVILFGSAIGVMRHKDFIPWDDDIDIGLPREDMNKLISIIQENYSEKYEILNFDTNKNFPLMTTHIILKGTKFVVPEFKGIKCNFGIYLDVFPLDYVAEDGKQRKKQLNKAWFYSKLMILRSMGGPKLPVKGIIGKIAKGLCWIIHILLKVFHISRRWIHNGYMKQAVKQSETSIIGHLASTKPGEFCYRYNDLFPPKLKDFGEQKVYVANNCDKILRQNYGDYMIMPDVNNRINHTPIVLDFGKYK